MYLYTAMLSKLIKFTLVLIAVVTVKKACKSRLQKLSLPYRCTTHQRFGDSDSSRRQDHKLQPSRKCSIIRLFNN